MEMKGGRKGHAHAASKEEGTFTKQGIKHSVAYSGIYVTTTTMPASPLFRLGKIRRNNTESQTEVNRGQEGGNGNALIS